MPGGRNTRCESSSRASATSERSPIAGRIMSLRVVRLGTPRHADEGLRLGTVRRPPRGVPRSEFASRDYYDVWLPDLAPSATLLAWVTSQPMTQAIWNRFTREYRKEMRTPSAERLISLLAALSSRTNVSVGCYCEDESRCHRSLLHKLLVDAGATVVTR
jgi:uncharacterized protein YeaO (DUF488 family)